MRNSGFSKTITLHELRYFCRYKQQHSAGILCLAN